MAKPLPPDRELIAQRRWSELGERHDLSAEMMRCLESLPSPGQLTLDDILTLDRLGRGITTGPAEDWDYFDQFEYER